MQATTRPPCPEPQGRGVAAGAQDRSQHRSVMAGKVKVAEFPAAVQSPGPTS